MPDPTRVLPETSRVLLISTAAPNVLIPAVTSIPPDVTRKPVLAVASPIESKLVTSS